MNATTDIDELAGHINHWANGVFPARTDNSMFLKLYGEIAEMIDADDAHVGGEIADVFIMLLDYAIRKGVRLSDAIADKMAINEERVWAKNKLGAYSHVKSSEDALRVPPQPQSGSGDAPVSGQTLAHDRYHPHAVACRAYGQCLAARMVDCPHFADDPLRSCRSAAKCDGPRPGRSILRGHPDALQAADRPGSNQQGRGDSPARRFQISESQAGLPGIPPAKAV